MAKKQTRPKAQAPEVILVAVLANYPPEEAETVLRKIILNLKKQVRNKRVLKKYINQLVMLSRLRKIEGLTIKITEEMPIHFDYESDTLYLKGTEKGTQIGIEKCIEQGIEKGIEKGKIEGSLEKEVQKNLEFTRNLLLNTDFTVEKIALLVGVGVEYIQKVKLDLEAN
ncbi:MAG: Rpn family recombination-promoting nuclease/putative transposase [Saprospiraceae bacterium]|nr:Rpn family recombination-promoting nuclease/putative transposase [Saprospiraceae bacterium]